MRWRQAHCCRRSWCRRFWPRLVPIPIGCRALRRARQWAASGSAVTSRSSTAWSLVRPDWCSAPNWHRCSPCRRVTTLPSSTPVLPASLSRRWRTSTPLDASRPSRSMGRLRPSCLARRASFFGWLVCWGQLSWQARPERASTGRRSTRRNACSSGASSARSKPSSITWPTCSWRQSRRSRLPGEPLGLV